MKMKKHIITAEEYAAVKEAEKKSKLKESIQKTSGYHAALRSMKDCEIAEKLGYHRKRVSQLCAEFKTVGLETYAQHKYGGNHRSLSDEEEERIITDFERQAEYATKTPISNGTLYQLQGSLNSTMGRFEWITQGGQVTHRMFVSGGGMNGIPIMP